MRPLGKMPEAFVVSAAIRREVWRAVKAGALRKLASRLYTRNLRDSPETVVRRNLWDIVAGYFPQALVADRTAFECRPADDGSVCLVSDSGRDIRLPGIVLRPRRGAPALATDLPFHGQLRLSSPARAYVENMRNSRTRSGRVRRTLSRSEIEERLEEFVRRSGEDNLNRLRDQISEVGASLGMKQEAEALDSLIGAFFGTRKARLRASAAVARRWGRPYDPARLELFQSLQSTLRQRPPVSRISRQENADASKVFHFFEAYFSNFIEGIEFSVEEAEDIVLRGTIPMGRSADAHDIVGTWQVVSNSDEMNRSPRTYREAIGLLKDRHATVMAGRPELQPGEFKQSANRAGSTIFVAPDLVTGTIERGFEFYRSLVTPFDRAVFVMFLVTEVHPFSDGNGRVARIMMNAELERSNEQRIVIPTVFREDYIQALKGLSQNRRAEPLVRVLDYAQKWTRSVDWSSIDKAQEELKGCNAFLDPSTADARGLRLRMPEPWMA